ncbi:MAG TPA: hypothetical protein ENN61_04555, partial [Bacteroidaceae bacterium]|nr:hypothetical protein [Bacteroidaceae bacterium]
MKLTAFRIKNFRSIVDTGWQTLSHDNITSLIGQNESGKTSILEAIKAFHDGTIVEDMLRSDLSLPEVSCSFSFSYPDLEHHIDSSKIDPKIRKEIANFKEISIIRTWDDDLNTHVIMGKELSTLYERIYESRKERESKLSKPIEKFSHEEETAVNALREIKKTLADTEEKIEIVKQKISDLKRSGGSFFARERKKQVKGDLVSENEILEKLQAERKERIFKLREKQEIVDNLKHKTLAIAKLKETDKKIIEKKEEILNSQENLRQIYKIADVYSSEKEQRAAELKEVIYRNEIAGHKEQLEKLEKEYDRLLRALEKVFDG